MSYSNPMTPKHINTPFVGQTTVGLIQKFGDNDKLHQPPSTVLRTKTISKSVTPCLKKDSSIRVNKTESKLSKVKSTIEINFQLSEDQEEVLNAAKSGKSFFFTGAAGCGKSYVLNAIVHCLQKEKEVYITASTGIAACNINGITIYSFSGIGKGEGSSERLWEKVKKDKKALKKWRSVKVLIIDEISMIDAELFDKLEYIARKSRNCEEPFGGIQLIICGDFFQLPPISKNGTFKFVFESKSWSNVIKYCYYLTTIHRQNDQTFITLLNSIRIGEVTDEIIQCLKKCCSKISKEKCTHLLSFIKEVDGVNIKELKKLKGDDVIYTSIDSGSSIYLTSLKVPQELHLKEGALVMVNKNIDIERGLVNGSVGIIVGFDQTTKFSGQPIPKVKFSNRTIPINETSWDIQLGNKSVAKRVQIPLQLAWAISIHKSQGMTLERAVIKIDNVFQAGQAYVALSRLKSLDGLYIEGDVSKENFICNQKAKKFDEEVKSGKYKMNNDEKLKQNTLDMYFTKINTSNVEKQELMETENIGNNSIIQIDDDQDQSCIIVENHGFSTQKMIETTTNPRKSSVSLMEFENEEDEEGFYEIESIHNNVPTTNNSENQTPTKPNNPTPKSIINSNIFKECENDWKELEFEEEIPKEPKQAMSEINQNGTEKKKKTFSSEFFTKRNSKIYIAAPLDSVKDQKRSGRLSFSDISAIKRQPEPALIENFLPNPRKVEQFFKNEENLKDDENYQEDVESTITNHLFEDDEHKNLNEMEDENDLWMRLYKEDIEEGKFSNSSETKVNNSAIERKSIENVNVVDCPKRNTQTIEDLIGDLDLRKSHVGESKTDPIKIDDFDTESHEE